MILSIVNHKGGVGKTTTAVSLAGALVHMNKRVLVIDLDGQCNLTKTFGYYEPEVTIYDALKGGAELPILKHDSGVDVVPSIMDMNFFEAESVGIVGRDLLLKKCIEKVRKNYDYIIIDCPPSIGTITFNALTASSHFLIPVECEALSVIGLMKMAEVGEKIKDILNPDLELLGVLLTKFDRRKKINKQAQESVKAEFGDKVLKTLIRDNISLAECPMAKTHILDYKPESFGAEDYQNLSKEIDEYNK